MLGLQAKQTVTTLKAKSEKALGVFKQTISDLTTVNEQLAVEKQNRIDEQKRLGQEISEIDAQQSENANFIAKVNDFLGK